MRETANMRQSTKMCLTVSQVSYRGNGLYHGEKEGQTSMQEKEEEEVEEEGREEMAPWRVY